MPSPFPGMDPYLEHPDLWPDVHTRLAASLGDHLVPLVSPRYYVALEERTYLDDTSDLVFVGRPDVALVGAGGKNDATRVRTGARAMVLEVEVPIPDRRRETYLEVRGVGSGEVCR